jgi:MFS family permease
MLASAAIVNWWAVIAWVPTWVTQMVGGMAVEQRSIVMLCTYSGAVLGGFINIPVLMRLGRRNAFVLSFSGILCINLLMFLSIKTYSAALLLLAFLAGTFAELPFFCLFVSVPEMYPSTIRGTAFGISIQTGRIFAALAALAGGQLVVLFHGSYAIAGSFISLVALVGLYASFFVSKDDYLAEDAQPTTDNDSVLLTSIKS